MLLSFLIFSNWSLTGRWTGNRAGPPTHPLSSLPALRRIPSSAGHSSDLLLALLAPLPFRRSATQPPLNCAEPSIAAAPQLPTVSYPRITSGVCLFPQAPLVFPFKKNYIRKTKNEQCPLISPLKTAQVLCNKFQSPAAWTNAQGVP